MRPSGATTAFRRGRRNDLPNREPQSRPWVAPLKRCIVGDALANKRISTDDYPTLVDATGRVIPAGKRGAIPVSLAPILARPDLQVEDWIATMLCWRQMRGSAVGGNDARMADAARHGTRWVKNHARFLLAVLRRRVGPHRPGPVCPQMLCPSVSPITLRFSCPPCQLLSSVIPAQAWLATSELYSPHLRSCASPVGAALRSSTALARALPYPDVPASPGPRLSQAATGGVVGRNGARALPWPNPLPLLRRPRRC